MKLIQLFALQEEFNLLESECHYHYWSEDNHKINIIACACQFEKHFIYKDLYGKETTVGKLRKAYNELLEMEI